MKKLDDYQKVVEDFRHHYFTRYGVKLDDEILYLFIRMNEMHTDIKRDIRKLPMVQYNTNVGYFLHGISKPLIIALLIFNVIIILLNIILFAKII